MVQIDMNSDEFQAELEKTWSFVEKVNKQFGFMQNPNEEVHEGVAMGLARNRLIYGKRFCPCFMVIGETKEEQKAADNRNLPPASPHWRRRSRRMACVTAVFSVPLSMRMRRERRVK